jgi:hypothetical protein
VAGVSETLAGKHVLTGDEPSPGSAPERAPEPGHFDAGEHPTTTLEPPLGVPAPTNAPAEQVACPECGTVAMVALTRREAGDFCVQCDYPLFWTPSKIVLDSAASAGESLRRLPGASGRVTVASVPCPHCAEGNLVGAEVCLRCGGLMNPPAPEPAVVAPPPPPPPAPEPAPRTPWWVWVLGGTTLLLLVALIVYFLA